MHVFIIVALTADGYIAEETDDVSTSWTSKEDLQFFVERTKAARALVMGLTTFKTINKPLPGRKIYVYTRNPEALATFNPDEVEPVNMPPEELVKKAAKEGYTELAVSGGASIYTMFMKSGLVESLYLTIEPVVFGRGVSLFTEPINQRMILKATKNLSDQVLMLEYKLKNR